MERRTRCGLGTVLDENADFFWTDLCAQVDHIGVGLSRKGVKRSVLCDIGALNHLFRFYPSLPELCSR